MPAGRSAHLAKEKRLRHNLHASAYVQLWVVASVELAAVWVQDLTQRVVRHGGQSVPSRKWLGEYMQERGYPKMVIDWVGTNLVEAPGSKPGEGPYVSL